MVMVKLATFTKWVGQRPHPQIRLGLGHPRVGGTTPKDRKEKPFSSGFGRASTGLKVETQFP